MLWSAASVLDYDSALRIQARHPNSDSIAMNTIL